MSAKIECCEFCANWCSDGHSVGEFASVLSTLVVRFG